MIQMSEKIVVVSIPKFACPWRSFRIYNQRDDFYIYPGDFGASLQKINLALKNARNNPDFFNSELRWISTFGKKMEKHSYLVSKMKVDLSKPVEDIFHEVWKKFFPLISIFSLILTEIFVVNKIYVFEKRSWGFEFSYMIEQRDFHKNIYDVFTLKKFISPFEIELVFPCILSKLSGKDHYLEFIEGYITSKVKDFFIGNEISNYWNCLEHFASKYCKEKQKNKILDNKCLKSLTETIKKARNLLKKENIVFPDIDINDITSTNMFLPDNRPPIKKKIFYMLRRNKIAITEEQEKLIEIVYALRNKLYHQEYYISRLLHGLEKRFKLTDPTLKDIRIFVHRFSNLVEEIILSFFKIVPNYYHIRNDARNLISLELNDFDMSLLKNPSRENASREEDDKNSLLSKSKYASIVKFIDRFEERLSRECRKNNLSGTIQSASTTLKASINFKDDLDGVVEILSDQPDTIDSEIRVKFVSETKKEFGRHRLKCIIFLSSIHESGGTHSKNKTRGTFKALILSVNDQPES